jgi:hypothetical protein
MFEFKNKTIDEFRNEVLKYLGKEITLQGGGKVILDSVNENDIHYLSTTTGDFSFQKNGELDWNKAVSGVKMYGFMVTVSVTDNRGCKMSLSEKILVKYEDRNEKQYLVIYSDGSILSKNVS